MFAYLLVSGKGGSRLQSEQAERPSFWRVDTQLSPPGLGPQGLKVEWVDRSQRARREEVSELIVILGHVLSIAFDNLYPTWFCLGEFIQLLLFLVN